MHTYIPPPQGHHTPPIPWGGNTGHGTIYIYIYIYICVYIYIICVCERCRIDVQMSLCIYKRVSASLFLPADGGLGYQFELGNASHDRHDQQEPKSQVDISQPTGFQRAPLFQTGWKTNKIVVSCFIKTSQFIHRYVSIHIYRLSCCVVLPYVTLYIYIYITLHWLCYTYRYIWYIYI